MRPLAESGVRGAAFWLLVLASTAGYVVNGASTPVVPRLATDQLGADPALGGLLVSLAGFVAIGAMPVAGVLSDRLGPRRVLLGAGLLAAVGLGIVLVALSIPTLAVSRLVFGAGNAATATALTAWVVAEVPVTQRSRALGLFGLAVWIGLALGPVVGENLYQSAGHRSVWIVAIGIQLAGLAVALLARDGSAPAYRSPARPTGTGIAPVLRAVVRPGAAGLVAWAAEGFMIAFLIQHLVGQGVGAQGLTGAANVFTVFAASVVGVRLLLGGLPDRVGPVRTARGALVVLAAGLVVLAVAHDFPTAAAGAVLVGAGYSPLFPTLTILSTRTLDDRSRATGVGVFSAVTSAGYAVGSLVGGVLVSAVGSGWALVVLAALQLAAVPALGRHDRGR
ncbi:MFS transporter [Curtobacterium sp. ZW137]|uniref:MFS transporter n=1 Tax=Curtobacterium sp. ZW137 TaxID=2485104 RepID=UPI000FAAAB43|nr:MFS transporter [Curtobacterium sp. ZW137]ROP63689.1 putative MFS family arabinose efflux permease [Curtobacterium sp. ZW137]